MNISHLSLRNGGGFVCRLHILVRRPNGRPGGFHQEVVVEDGNDILLGQEKASHIGYADYKIPTGSHVRLRACVIGGKDNDSPHSFIFKDNAGTAAFVITGTIWDNYLGLVSMPR